MGEEEFRDLLDSYVNFETGPELLDGTQPGLFLSAIDVCAGTFEVFLDHQLNAELVVS